MAQVTIDGLPVFQALVGDDEDLGMIRISLVDDPAVQSNFLAFSAAKKPLMYAIQDEEKRMVLGVVMRADFPIYRRDGDFEYYIIFKAETIRRMAEKYLVDSRQNAVDLMHDGKEVEDVHMVQYFIKGGTVSVEGFDGIADGSLFAEYHVTNDEVWDAVKAGTYKGFSLEGYFDLQAEQDKPYVEQVVDILDGKFQKILKPNEYTKMKKKGLLQRLAKALVEMGNVTTDKGILAWDGDEDLKAGDSVYIEDADGNRSDAPDGDYVTGDGKTIVVEGGKVSEIRDPQAEVEPSGEEFASKDTDKGLLEWEGEDDLKEGDAVYVTDENGERVPAGDGEYTTEDGKVIVVVDGKVAEIRDAKAEVAPEEMTKMQRISAAFSESYEDRERRIYDAIISLGFDYFYIVEAGDDYAVICHWDEEREHFTRFAISWGAEGNAIAENPEEVVPAFETPEEKAKKDSAAEEVEELRSEVAKLRKAPLARIAHAEYQEVAKVEKTGDSRLDRLARIASAK